MAQQTTASGRWEELSAARTAFITRCELYAAYTLPKICPPQGYNQATHDSGHDFQAVGAQSVNHLSNKIMLALFAPSRPFFRADPDDDMKAKMKELEVSELDAAEALAQAEKDAVQKLDQIALRPKLYETIKHLIVTGNVLLYLDELKPRVMGLKKYVCRRSADGTLIEVITGDRVRADELDIKVRTAMSAKQADDTLVNHYCWIKRDEMGDYRMTQWVDAQKLDESFDGKWPANRMPYRCLTWDLADGSDYGTGLVEDYSPDFAALSALSRAQVVGAVLASEFRWLVNPAGLTRPEDLENSANGSAIPGVQGDISLIQSGKAGDLQMVQGITAEYVNRIGRGFLMGASQVRNAERVTAEEIRLIANELETALGGAYSRLAVDIQLPMALWLMDLIGLTTAGSGFNPTVVTGLEALSRTGDLEELKLLFADLAGLGTLPEILLARLKLPEVMKAFAAARRVSVSSFFKSEQEVQQEQQAAQQAQLQEQAASGAIDATVAQAGAPPQQGQPE